MRLRIGRLAVACLLLAPALSAQEQQAPDNHAFGVLPNYRTAESSIPFQPISAKRKLYIATKDTVDGPSYVSAAIFAGIYQATNQNPSFGQGVKGYGLRYVTSIADLDLGNYLTEGFMPALLREDPRYFRLGAGSKTKRVLYALSRVLITRTDRDTRTFNFAEFLGNGITGAVGNAYYADDRGFGPTVQRTLTQIGNDSIANLLREFWPDVKKHLIRHKQPKQ
ncbi:MAG TPA: hypothetical protein VHA14_14005, partial [Bryobacteraceae bacterium]|nr:hypothetical protein [Bryobacteraceae bacterium]